MDNQYSFGLWMKTVRMSHGWTQAELSERIGCSISTIRKLETDERQPSKQLAKRLAYHLDVPVDRIMSFMGTAHQARHLSKSNASIDPHLSFRVHDQSGFRPITPLLGRSQELASIDALVQRQDIHLVTLVGLGGVGKTHLAYVVADDVHATFAQGAHVVDLAAITSVDELLSVLMALLSLPVANDRTLTEQVIIGLQDYELLLVLDNFDHFFDAIPFVCQLLALAPQVKLLVTSRVPLQITGEHTFRVSPLVLPDATESVSLPQLESNPAIALLVAHVQALLPDFQLTVTNAAAMSNICHQVDGLPLALEMAAAHFLMISPEALADQLTHDVSMLVHIGRQGSSRQQSLYDTIHWSYALLTPEVQHILVGLSVFAGGGSMGAITAVCTHEDMVDRPEFVAQSLIMLLEYSLVTVQDNVDQERRCTMLETVRAMASQEGMAQGVLSVLQQRHAEYFTQWAESHCQELLGAGQIETLQAFDREMENMYTALEWCHQHEQSVLLARLSVALYRFWYIRSLWQEGLKWYQRALAKEDLLPEALHAAVLSSASGLSFIQNDYPRAIEWLDAAIAKYRMLDDRLELARTLKRRGGILQYQGQLTEARALLEESLSYCRQLDSPRDTANILGSLGLVCDKQGSYDQAMAFHQASLDMRRLLGDTHGMIGTLLNLGSSATSQRDYVTAQRCFEEGLAQARTLAYHHEEALFLTALGLNACYQLHLTEAQSLLMEGLAKVQHLQDRLNEARALGGLGVVATLNRDYESAIALLNQSIKLFAMVGSWGGVPQCLEYVAYAYVGMAQYEYAIWLLMIANQLRIKDEIPRSPVEIPLYEEVWAQLNTHGFTYESMVGWVGHENSLVV